MHHDQDDGTPKQFIKSKDQDRAIARVMASSAREGLEGPALAAAKNSLLNARVDGVVTATFLVFVTIIVCGTAYECWLLLSGCKPVVLRESPYVALGEG